MLLQGHAQLGQATLAGGATGRFLHRADGRKHHADQNGDDGDDDQQFDERKTAAWTRIANCGLAAGTVRTAIGQGVPRQRQFEI